MKTVRIALNTIDEINSFVHDMDSAEGEAAICFGRYYVDTKSLMEILTLDLTRPLELKIETGKKNMTSCSRNTGLFQTVKASGSMFPKNEMTGRAMV